MLTPPQEDALVQGAAAGAEAAETTKPETPQGRLSRFPRSTWWLLPAVTVSVGLFHLFRPISDVDSYWHVLVGREIAEGNGLGGSDSWTFGPGDQNWKTTQWASELLMWGLHAAFGWVGLTLMCLGCFLAVVILQARQMLFGPGSFAVRTMTLAAVIFAVAADLQERPVAISLVFLSIVSRWAVQVVRGQAWPAWWKILGLTVIWVQFHGYWILLPFTIVLVTAVQLTGSRPGWARVWQQSRQPVLLTVGSVAVAVASPAGAFSYKAPVVFKAAAGPWLDEWAATTVEAGSFCALLVLVGAIVAAWASRLGPAVPTAEVLYVAAWFTFAVLAYRNVAVAIVMLAPVVADRCARAFSASARNWDGTPATRVTWLAIGAVLVAGLGGASVRFASEPRIPKDLPLEAFALLDALPGDRQVLNEYNQGGPLIALTRPGVQAAIDGRADRYGADGIGAWRKMVDARPGWEKTFALYSPTEVLLNSDMPLISTLTAQGWQVLLVTKKDTLLTRPAP